MDKTQIDSLIKLKDQLAEYHESYRNHSCDLDKAKILNLLARQIIAASLVQIEYDIYMKKL